MNISKELDLESITPENPVTVACRKDFCNENLVYDDILKLHLSDKDEYINVYSQEMLVKLPSKYDVEINTNTDTPYGLAIISERVDNQTNTVTQEILKDDTPEPLDDTADDTTKEIDLTKNKLFGWS